MIELALPVCQKVHAFCDGDGCETAICLHGYSISGGIDNLRSRGWLVDSEGNGWKLTCPTCQIREARGEHLV